MPVDPRAYLIALGSNQRHERHGPPRAVLRAALAALESDGITVLAASRIVDTPPLGPSRRRFANAAAVVRGPADPERLMDRLRACEDAFGRTRTGQKWRARALDLDIILWGAGVYASDDLVIPHPAFRERSFVLAPAKEVAAQWRDPLTGLSLHHLHARLTRTGRPPR